MICNYYSYPSISPDIPASGISSIVGGNDASSSEDKGEKPAEADPGINEPLGGSVATNNRQVGVDGDGDEEEAAADNTNAVQPALGPAGSGADKDAVANHPLEVESVAEGSVHLGEQQVEDQQRERVTSTLLGGSRVILGVIANASARLIPACNETGQKLVGEEEKQAGGGDERDQGSRTGNSETDPVIVRELGESVALGNQRGVATISRHCHCKVADRCDGLIGHSSFAEILDPSVSITIATRICSCPKL